MMKKHFKDNFMTQNHSYLTEEMICDNLERYFLNLKQHNFYKLISLWNNYVHNKITVEDFKYHYLWIWQCADNLDNEAEEFVKKYFKDWKSFGLYIIENNPALTAENTKLSDLNDCCIVYFHNNGENDSLRFYTKNDLITKSCPLSIDELVKYYIQLIKQCRDIQNPESIISFKLFELSNKKEMLDVDIEQLKDNKNYLDEYQIIKYITSAPPFLTNH